MLPSLFVVLSPCLGFFDRTTTSLRKDRVLLVVVVVAAAAAGVAFSRPSGLDGSRATLSCLTSSISDLAFGWTSGLL